VRVACRQPCTQSSLDPSDKNLARTEHATAPPARVPATSLAREYLGPIIHAGSPLLVSFLPTLLSPSTPRPPTFLSLSVPERTRRGKEEARPPSLHPFSQPPPPRPGLRLPLPRRPPTAQAEAQSLWFPRTPEGASSSPTIYTGPKRCCHGARQGQNGVQRLWRHRLCRSVSFQVGRQGTRCKTKEVGRLLESGERFAVELLGRRYTNFESW
jgi:hypothetical protein